MSPSDAPSQEGKDADETMAEAALFTQFLTEAEDATGLAAYALHRRARLDFIRAYAERTGAEPDEAALTPFMIGEMMASRIDAYRAEAARLIAQQSGAGTSAAPPLPNPKRFLTWGLGEAIAHAQKPLPWRALALRLLVLLAAVVVTALMLRVLVVAP